MSNFDFKHGSESEHRQTLERARDAEVNYLWSGDMRSDYLRENFNFALSEGIFTADFIESEQESGWIIAWKD